jgi:tellurite resistance protein TerC
MAHESIYFWIGLIGGLILLTFVDYYIEKGRELTTKMVSLRVIAWVGLAIAFNIFIFFDMGKTKALEFLTGYIVEYSLSVDNLFVFIMLFEYFKADGKQELKALQWGIYGAMIMRLIFILFGVTLIHLFHPVIYFFGIILLYTAYKMQFANVSETDPKNLPLVKLAKKAFPITDEYHGTKFFIRRNGGLWATPMVVLVLAVESSDVMFAVDSIPAVLAITTDTFIVFSSNIFAILGLRALFFLLARLMVLFRFLKTGVAFILAFVGIKMLLSDLFHIPVGISLGVIVSVLTISIVLSKVFEKKDGK